MKPAHQASESNMTPRHPGDRCSDNDPSLQIADVGVQMESYQASDPHVPKVEEAKSSGKRHSLNRLKMKGPPSMVFCLIMILTGMFYTFHHKKLHELGGSEFIHSRLEREYTNLGILAALMMAIVFTQVFAMHDVKKLFFVLGDDASAVSWQYQIQICLLGLAGCLQVLSLIFSIMSLVTLNLVAPDELLLYIEHASWTVKLPVLMLTYGTLAWIFNLMFYVFFLCDVYIGVVISGMILCCAILVFYTWCVMLQATFVASQHAELLEVGIQEFPSLPGYFKGGGTASHFEKINEKVSLIEEGCAKETEQKLVRRLSKKSLPVAERNFFAISNY